MGDFPTTVAATGRLVCGLAAAVIISAAVHAEDAPCGNMPNLPADEPLTLGRVSTAADRVHFVKDAAAQPGCPNQKPACLERAYVVPGDLVILTARRDAFVCATYINAKGIETSGWLPAVAVADDKAPPVAAADWLGKWSRVEAEIRVKAGKAGALAIEGDATFGAKDPARVKRGGVNVGEIAADVTPAGDRLSFAMGEDATLPVDKGDEFTCRVWMRRLGPWLIVNDNNHCGGFNIAFSGFYTRKP
jgi:hypothetical protein